MNTAIPASHFNAFTVEEFDAPTKEDQRRKARSWTKVGAAFPVNGRLVALPPNSEEVASALARDSRARG
jgi:hypothetical protein